MPCPFYPGTAFFMDITIDPLTASDLSEVLGLMRGFAEYENLSDYFTVTEERLRGAMFAPGGFVEGLIARIDGSAVGYALFYPAFSSFRGERGLYLEDIYIDPDHRRHDLGHRMLKKIARRAAERGFERIDFMVLDWNDPAVKFYLKHGAEKNDDESHFKFGGEAFARLAGE